jgi:hypothetical protein
MYGVYYCVWEKGTASVFKVQFQVDFEVIRWRKSVSHVGQFEEISANWSCRIRKRGYDMH